MLRASPRIHNICTYWKCSFDRCIRRQSRTLRWTINQRPVRLWLRSFFCRCQDVWDLVEQEMDDTHQRHQLRSWRKEPPVERVPINCSNSNTSLTSSQWSPAEAAVLLQALILFIPSHSRNEITFPKVQIVEDNNCLMRKTANDSNVKWEGAFPPAPYHESG